MRSLAVDKGDDQEIKSHPTLVLQTNYENNTGDPKSDRR